MVSICGKNNSKSSYELSSSDVFVKLSEHTSTEMSDFTVFVVVFLSMYLHLQSLKYYVAEMILGSRSVFLSTGSISAHSPNDVLQKLDQSKTFDFSLVKLVQSFVSNDEPADILPIKKVISGLIALGVAVTFLVLASPHWPRGMGGENFAILAIILLVASFGVSMLLVSVETPALPWIIFVSLVIATYAVVRTSKCNEDRACLEKPDGESDNFLDFDYKWLVVAISLFALKKILFIILFLRRYDSIADKTIRGLGFVLFLVFYIFMILTTFISSPETKQNQYVPCTLKGSFVGQLIYWPLFLIIIFYIERGSYNTLDESGEVNKMKWFSSVISFVLSFLMFLVPLVTILEWQGNPQNKNACTVRQPEISLDTPGGDSAFYWVMLIVILLVCTVVYVFIKSLLASIATGANIAGRGIATVATSIRQGVATQFPSMTDYSRVGPRGPSLAQHTVRATEGTGTGSATGATSIGGVATRLPSMPGHSRVRIGPRATEGTWLLAEHV